MMHTVAGDQGERCRTALRLITGRAAAAGAGGGERPHHCMGHKTFSNVATLPSGGTYSHSLGLF
jgi:hypothetical protein